MKRPNISPEEYGRILKHIELRDIYLTETKAKIDEAYKAPRLELAVKDKSTFEADNNQLKVISRYTFTAKGEDKEKPFLQITAVYRLLFSIKEGVKVTQDFFDVFQQLSLGIIVWPYFREFVQGLISRMNLPPLTLPMRKALTK